MLATLRWVGRTLALLVVLLPLAGCSSGSAADERSTPAGSSSAGPPAAGGPAKAGGRDWGRYGFDAQRSNVGPHAVGFRAPGRLRRHRIRLPGTVDSSPIYLHRIRAGGRPRDVFFVTTTYGRTLAIDASRRRIVWRFTPRGIAGLEGSAQITNTTPIADPSRRYVYAASPNGQIHKLSVRSGREAPGWPVAVTRDPTHEKLAGALNLSGRYVVAVTGGYLGDEPPYQGHVLAISRSSGRIAHVFNTLCSDRRQIIEPSSCGSSDAAIWARAGAVVLPRSHRLLVTTGNAPFDGHRDWGDSVLMLAPAATRLLQSYTPASFREFGRRCPRAPATGTRRSWSTGGSRCRRATPTTSSEAACWTSGRGSNAVQAEPVYNGDR